MSRPRTTLLDPAILRPALLQALRKLDPRLMWRNPVMFSVEVVSTLTTILLLRDLLIGAPHPGFAIQINLWLWLTLLFANFAEAVAEGRGRAQAASLRQGRAETIARRRRPDGSTDTIPASTLRQGDVVEVAAGEIIPSDGEVIEGAASVNEAAITGESAPVIREAGGDRSAVTGGTQVMSDVILVRITAAPGHTFIDRMIALVEGASRQKTPNEIALNILLAGLTLIFVMAVATIPAFATYAGGSMQILVLVALFVTLIPTTIGALLSAIGIAQLASLSDETPEGRSIVVLAKDRFGFRATAKDAVFVPFTAQTRMSGVDIGTRRIRKGAVDAILADHPASPLATELRQIADRIAKQGGTPLAVVDGSALLGVVHLKDIVKGGIAERFAELRRMGIRTVMITGDNPLTAAAIAAEAGVDDFLAQATPEAKLALIRQEQEGGRLVAMCGDGTNDAPALAQADVGVAMNTGTQAAREAGNMVDLDSDPTKLIEIVEIGKQLLMTRGALTTFSIANDVAKYFAIIPAMFLAFYPQLAALNVMHLASPQSAILSAIIFNALIIIALIPLALRGVAYRAIGAGPLLRRNLLVYGLGGILAPFAGIKLIDMLVAAFGLA